MVELQKPHTTSKRLRHSPDEGGLGRAQNAKMTPPLTSPGVNGSSQCGKKRGNGLSLVENGHLPKRFEFMGGILCEPEMNKRSLHVFVAGFWERNPSQNSFADLSRADNHYRRELVGQFPQPCACITGSKLSSDFSGLASVLQAPPALKDPVVWSCARMVS